MITKKQVEFKIEWESSHRFCVVATHSSVSAVQRVFTLSDALAQVSARSDVEITNIYPDSLKEKELVKAQYERLQEQAFTRLTNFVKYIHNYGDDV